MKQSEYHPFPNTHWSLVRRAGVADSDTHREALSVLLARYQPALIHYLRFVWRLSAQDAEDILQAFFADHILERDLLRRADKQRGRFRSFLVTSLRNFAVSRWRSEQVQAGPLHYKKTVQSESESPPAILETAWARELINGVLRAMKEECRQNGRDEVWMVFEGRVLAEIFENAPPVAYETLAADLRLSSPMQAANLLVTAKRMFARLLRAAVAEYEQDDSEIDGEIGELRRILASATSMQFE